MREIKFRVWSKYKREMREVSDDWFVGDLKHKAFLVMQYTNLKDKNGKEIYEGDIICVVEDALDGGQEGDFMQVLFDEFGCWSLDGGEIIKGELLYEQHKYAEVIGNIYENPELINS